MGRIPGRVDSTVWLVGLVWGVAVYGFHKYGAITGWYLAYPWFQNLTHAASASGVALLLGLLGAVLGYRHERLVVFIVAMTAVAAVGWEIVEYLGWLDQFGVYLMFHDLNDAAVDMASNAVGTFAAVTALWMWTGLDPAGEQ